MRRLLALALPLALMVAGCALPSFSLGAPGAAPPAPLAGTVIDDQAVNFALESFDASLTLVDAAIDAGKIKPGTPEAKTIAAKIRQVDHLLAVASAAQKAGQATSYAEAFREARSALAELKAAFPAR
jgi:hypothetical protein